MNKEKGFFVKLRWKHFFAFTGRMRSDSELRGTARKETETAYAQRSSIGAVTKVPEKNASAFAFTSQ